MKVKNCWVQLKNIKTEDVGVHQVSAYVFGEFGIYRDKTKEYPWVVFDIESGKAIWFGKYFKDAERYVKTDPDKLLDMVKQVRKKDKFKEQVEAFRKMIEEGKIAEVKE